MSREYSGPRDLREPCDARENAVVVTKSNGIEEQDFGEPSLAKEKSLAARYAHLDTAERLLIIEALDKAEGNMSEAARLLGISWIMLKRRIMRYDLTKRPET